MFILDTVTELRWHSGLGKEHQELVAVLLLVPDDFAVMVDGPLDAIHTSALDLGTDHIVAVAARLLIVLLELWVLIPAALEVA